MREVLTSWTHQLRQALLPEWPFDIRTQEIPLAHLPPAFEGFRIVQVSDMHIERWNRPVAEAAVDAVNGLNADMLVCTGDTIAHGAEYIPDVIYLLRQFKARHGKLACLGNHDYSDGSGSQAVRKAYRAAGFELLINDSTELTLHHQTIQIAGADDLILGRQCLETTHRRLDPEKIRLLLCHNPENFDALARFQPDLVLAGHTHGGQILPSRLHGRLIRAPYVAGLYELGGIRLYVNRGLGSAIIVRRMGERLLSLPTPRLAVRPEISVFTLTNPRLQGMLELDRHRLDSLAG